MPAHKLTPVSKPCGLPGCPNLISMPGPRTLATRLYCSRSCSAQARIAAGWNPVAHLTTEQHRLGGRRGGTAAGVNRRKRKVLETVAHLTDLIPADMQESLGYAELTRVKLLLRRAYDKGYVRGYRAAWAAKRAGRMQQKSEAA
jgi:hypothetical protein